MPDKPLTSPGAAAVDAVPRLVPLDAVLDRISVSKSSLYGMVRAKQFPAPAKIGRSARWLSSDVDAFVLRVAAASPSYNGRVRAGAKT